MKNLNELNLGVALCGSFCTFAKTIALIEELVNKGINVFPIMSFNAYNTSTRFGDQADVVYKIEALTNKSIIHTIVDAEPMGPKGILDALLIAPCTGNTLAKMTYGITDTPVLLAAKSLMRNGKPIIIALATNDGVGANLKNIGHMINKKDVYFVPLGQDDTIKKPYSLVADFSKTLSTIELALDHTQIQPFFIQY
ncbi:dipicolinate synthase subunit B [Cellulosilyticum lentocellum]|uniref:Flavoprotein n=1 Tax=Cellulosilyticum lentocellum (strain ATCC 49066 / DSM 5427 / NCIMB 11756 / RHM5) TaxID=642492 RepID=F2JR05_CELLD|nr:dipicolinate synthase subunit B [Cellulosilyticum lentocellum]ADZ83863.1 flavoprotein [Cellulosilyticum lentocellum DSM 5427]